MCIRDSFKGADQSEYVVYEQKDYGEGTYYFFSTGALFTNAYLKEAEHARLLWDMVSYEKPQKVWFVFSSDLSFWGLIWEHASYAVICLLLLLILWVWHSWSRFGPLFQTIDASENRVSEHLAATGYFFRRHGAHRLVIEKIQDDLLIKIARKVNLPVNASREEVIRACEKMHALTENELQLFTKPYPEKAREQVEYLQELQKLQSEL